MQYASNEDHLIEWQGLGTADLDIAALITKASLLRTFIFPQILTPFLCTIYSPHPRKFQFQTPDGGRREIL